MDILIKSIKKANIDLMIARSSLSEFTFTFDTLQIYMWAEVQE